MLAGHGPILDKQRAESWGEARCGYERGWLATGIWMGEYRKAHCLGELTPLLAGVLLTAVFGHMT